MTFKSLNKRFTGAGLLILLWIASAQPSWAQRIAGDIVGTITDSSGSAIPNAKVTLRSLETARQMETLASETGDYSFVELKPGRYEVMAVRPGFARKAVSGISLSAVASLGSLGSLDMGSPGSPAVAVPPAPQTTITRERTP